MIEQLTSNRLNWKAKVKRRQLHMEEYERKQGKTYAIPEGTDKIDQRSQAVECDDAKFLYTGCNRAFRSRAALTIHQKRLHRDLTNASLFVCPNCSNEFRQEGSMNNHHKRCNGERTFNGKKECKICMKWISKANFPKNRLSCGANGKEFSGAHNSSTRIWRTTRKKFRKCNKIITVAKHQQ